MSISETDEPLLSALPSSLQTSENVTEQSSRRVSLHQQLKTKNGYGLSLLTFFICGLGNLLPWNFLITPLDYWLLKLQTPQNITFLHAEENRLQSFWENFLSIASMLPMVVAGFLTSFGLILKHNSSFRISICLFVMLFSLLFNQIYIFIDVSKIIPLFFTSTMIVIMTLSAATSTFGCSISGIASKFGQKHINLMLTGQAAAGVLAAVANIISILILNNKKVSFSLKLLSGYIGVTSDEAVNVEKAAFCFFSLAVLLLVVNLVIYFKFIKSGIYLFLFESGLDNSRIRDGENEDGTEDESEPLMTTSSNSLSPNVEPLNWKIFAKTVKLSKSTIFQITLANFINLALFPSVCSSFSPYLMGYKNLMPRILRRGAEAKHFQTFALYNAEKRRNLALYRSIWIFLNFNLGDCVGRLLAGQTNCSFQPKQVLQNENSVETSQSRSSSRNSNQSDTSIQKPLTSKSFNLLTLLHVFRVAFLIIIPLCNVDVGTRKHFQPVILRSILDFGRRLLGGDFWEGNLGRGLLGRGFLERVFERGLMGGSF